MVFYDSDGISPVHTAESLRQEAPKERQALHYIEFRLKR